MDVERSSSSQGMGEKQKEENVEEAVPGG